MNKNYRTSPLVQWGKYTAGRFLCRSVENFVFVATPGRTGTKTLFNLCAAVSDCAAFHEPPPSMNGDILNAYGYNQEDIVSDYFRKFKLPAIYKASLKKKNYLETNHIFIKCFCKAAAAEFSNRLKVIHLLRDRHAVARSWLKWSAIPGKGFQGPWLPDPFAPRHSIQYADLIDHNRDFDHDYLKCLWYWYETEAQLLLFKKAYPQISIYELKTEDLNQPDVLIPLFKEVFGDFDTHKLVTKIGTRAHSSSESPKPPLGLGQVLINEFDELCTSKLRELKLGLQLDTTPALETADYKY